MKNDLWFEAAASTRMRIPANYPVSPPYIPNTPTVPTRPVTQVICNQCNGGFPTSNIFQGTECPKGWTTDKDPCQVVGCTDPNSITYNPLATIETQDGLDENGNPLCQYGDPMDEESIEPIVVGCMDPNSLTYNPLANVEPDVLDANGNPLCQYMDVFQPDLTNIPEEEPPTPVVIVNPQPTPPVEEKKDNNDLILYIAIGVGAYLLLK